MYIVRSFPRALIALYFAAAVTTACGGSSSPTGPSTPATPTPPAPPPPVATTTVEYRGLFGSGMFTGTVSLTAVVPVSATAYVPDTAQDVASASGTAKFSGASTTTVNLTGTYDTATGRFTLSGGAWSIDATVVDGRATGTIVTPAGAGSIAALTSTASAPVSQYCGSYSGTESGKFLVVIRNGLATGVAAQDGEPGGVTLAGSANGNSISLSWSWTDGSGGQGLAIGTINGTTVGGTWSNTDGQSGIWSGSGC